MVDVKHYIVTHGGKPHLDDFLSCCLVLSRDENIDRIERRDLLFQELYDKSVWVLDIGKDYNPEKKIIDHHHKEMDDCTLSLLLKYWDIWEQAKEVFGWIEVVTMMDSKGPRRTLQHMDLPYSTLYQFRSFTEVVILDEFENHTVIHKEDILFGLMKKIGDKFLHNINKYYEAVETIQKTSKIKLINKVPVIQCLTEDDNNPFFKRVLSEKRRYLWGEGGISVTPNFRPPNSIGITRYDNDTRVDFTLVEEDNDDVIFIHPNGFFMVVKSVSEKKINEYIRMGIK